MKPSSSGGGGVLIKSAFHCSARANPQKYNIIGLPKKSAFATVASANLSIGARGNKRGISINCVFCKIHSAKFAPGKRPFRAKARYSSLQHLKLSSGRLAERAARNYFPSERFPRRRSLLTALIAWSQGSCPHSHIYMYIYVTRGNNASVLANQ